VPLSYRRDDDAYEVDADWAYLADGFACIARELERVGKRPFARLVLSRAKVTSQGFVMWEETLAPKLVVTIPHTAFSDSYASADLERKRWALDNSRAGLAAFLAPQASADYASRHDPTTGLLRIEMDQAMLNAAGLRLDVDDGEQA
jgi:hypothetical protein